MRRLLLVAQIFPPDPLPGALRPAYLTRYLPRFGWDVTVLTQASGEPPFPAHVIHAGALGDGLQAQVRATMDSRGAGSQTRVRSMIRALKSALLFPDPAATWIPPAINCGLRAAREQRFDAILGTALPASVHVVGSALAHRTGLAWVADYRDPWTGNAYVNRGAVRRRLEALVERRLLRRAAAVTTISQPIAGRIGATLGRDDVHIIPNAYDPSEWESIGDATPKRFDLCFTGQMYDGKRTPDVLFRAIAALRAQGDPAGLDARIEFYGRNSDHVSENARLHGLSPAVRQHGLVPRFQAMQAQRAAAALLIFLNADPATSHEMGSKYLEYAGAKRPIIAIGPHNSVMRDFLHANRLGWFAANVEEAKAALRAAHERFRGGLYETAVDVRAMPSAIDLARRFAELLDSLTSGKRAAA